MSDKPSIPAAQVKSDWNSTSGLSQILNKPTLFDGAYTSLTGAPTVPATFNDLADVNIPSPVNNQYIKWDTATTRWVQGTGSAGISNIVEDTTPQLGGTLDANSNKIDMGTNEITDAKVGQWNTAYGWGNHASAGYLTSDANTTYSQQAVQDNADVKLRLVDSSNVQDDIKLTAGTNITFTGVGANGFTINSTASGSSGATVTTDDNAPSTPADGDLWWKSDEGRLKVYYTDPNGSQWVDTNPPLAVNSLASGSNSIAVTSTRSTVTGPLRVTGTLTGQTTGNKITYASHFIPDTNAAYDLGNAEYKVRHLFLSDNTLYFEGSFLKVAQHNSGGGAQAASYLITLAKLKDALNASGDYEAFKNAILAITDA